MAAGLLNYWNSLSIPFVWDDESAIVTNETIRQLWPLSIPLSPPHDTPMAGRPLVNLSIGLNYAFGGLKPSGYHAWNVGVHVLCALLLFGIVRRSLATSALTGPPFGVPAESTALLAALLWMLHPLTSEAVDYVSQRTESMMGLFFLLTLYAAIRSGSSSSAWRWEAVAWLACGCGMASKESMVAAPLVVLLYERALRFGSFGEALRARTRLFAGLALTWFVLAWLMWQGSRSTVGFSTVSPRTYLLNQLQMIVAYLRLSVWPRSLVLDYGVPKALALQNVLPEAVLVSALLTAALLVIMRWPRVGWLAAVAVLTLAPTSSVVPIATEVGAERRMYVPLMALSVLAVVGGRLLLDRIVARDRGSSRRIVLAATVGAGCALVALGVRTFYRNKEFQDPVALWRTVVDRRPSGRAHLGLGMALIAAGQRSDGVAELRTAAGDYGEARGILGVELFADGRTDEAIAQLGLYVADRPLDPSRIPAHLLRGEALRSAGRLNEAVAEFRTVLQQAPHHLPAREDLGDALSSLGRVGRRSSSIRRWFRRWTTIAWRSSWGTRSPAVNGITSTIVLSSLYAGMMTDSLARATVIAMIVQTIG